MSKCHVATEEGKQLQGECKGTRFGGNGGHWKAWRKGAALEPRSQRGDVSREDGVIRGSSITPRRKKNTKLFSLFLQKDKSDLF